MQKNLRRAILSGSVRVREYSALVYNERAKTMFSGTWGYSGTSLSTVDFEQVNCSWFYFCYQRLKWNILKTSLQHWNKLLLFCCFVIFSLSNMFLFCHLPLSKKVLNWSFFLKFIFNNCFEFYTLIFDTFWFYFKSKFEEHIQSFIWKEWYVTKGHN